MHKIVNSLSKSGWRRIAFSLVVLAYLGFLGFIILMMLLPGNWISAMGHFGFVYTGDTHNLVHELIFALIVGTAAVGLFSQLWKPKENFAGQLVALIVWAAMILTAVITNNWVPQPLYIIFGGLTLMSTILHPAGLGLFHWIRRGKVNRIDTGKANKILLTLSIIAAVPLLAFALTNINLQIAGGEGTGFFHTPPAFHSNLPDQEPVNDKNAIATDADSETDHDEQEHSNQGHYRNMAALSFIIILTGILASIRPKGWRLAAWVAGLLPILFGFASAILPHAESGIGFIWGTAAIIWGAAFIAIAEKNKNAEL